MVSTSLERDEIDWFRNVCDRRSRRWNRSRRRPSYPADRRPEIPAGAADERRRPRNAAGSLRPRSDCRQRLHLRYASQHLALRPNQCRRCYRCRFGHRSDSGQALGGRACSHVSTTGCPRPQVASTWCFACTLRAQRFVAGAYRRCGPKARKPGVCNLTSDSP